MPDFDSFVDSDFLVKFKFMMCDYFSKDELRLMVLLINKYLEEDD